MKKISFFVFVLSIPFVVFSQNPPVAVIDSAVAIPGYSVTVDVLSNDYDLDGDSIFIVNTGGQGEINGQFITYDMPFEMYGGQSGIKKFKYYISDDTSSWFNSHDTGYIY